MADVVWPRICSCFKCGNRIALHDDIITKGFQQLCQYCQSKSGRAFLFCHATNIVGGAEEDRRLITGLHTVADVYCSDCGELLGWRYQRAYEESHKYKEGKIVLEKFQIIKENCQSHSLPSLVGCSKGTIMMHVRDCKEFLSSIE